MRLPRLLFAAFAAAVLAATATAAPASAGHPERLPQQFYAEQTGEDLCTLFTTTGEIGFPAVHPPLEPTARIKGRTAILPPPPGTPCLAVVPFPREVVFTGYVGPIGDGIPVVADSVPVETSGSYELDLVSGRGLDYVTIAVCVPPEYGVRNQCGDEVVIDPRGGSDSRYCTFSYAIVGEWGTGWQGEVGLTPLVEPARDWLVIIRLPDGTAIHQAWNATITVHRGVVEFRPPGWTSTIPVGATYRFGFIGTGPTPPVSNVEAYVNGTRCANA